MAWKGGPVQHYLEGLRRPQALELDSMNIGGFSGLGTLREIVGSHGWQVDSILRTGNFLQLRDREAETRVIL